MCISVTDFIFCSWCLLYWFLLFLWYLQLLFSMHLDSAECLYFAFPSSCLLLVLILHSLAVKHDCSHICWWIKLYGTTYQAWLSLFPSRRLLGAFVAFGSAFLFLIFLSF
uniref:Protein yippee-like n=1 Tax=Rhizophora mucronata TaxID=61149 RepID=A0A2P2K2F5_RHIMU